MHVRRHSCAISDAGIRFPSLASETPIAEAARFTPGRFQLGPIRSLPAELIHTQSSGSSRGIVGKITLRGSSRGSGLMSILNSILGQVSGDATVQNLASKVGLSPEQAEQAIAALGQAHAQEGDTVQTAAQDTGLPADKLSQIVQHLGAKGL